MLRLSILGSCVTADPAYLNPQLVQVACYLSRTSFISLNSPPLPIDDDALPWPSNFARKAVLGDFRKTILPVLAGSQPDALVFDFIDDRFDLLQCGDSFVLRSDPLLESGFPGTLPLTFHRLQRRSSRVSRLWERSSLAVTARLRELLPTVPFILHRCWYADEYRDENQIRLFPENERRGNAAMNEMLEDYYDWFQRKIPGMRAVEVKLPRRAWAQHKWGLEPFHFEPAYGEELIRQIVRATAPSS